mgnify:CR=1 FL=1
MPGAGSAIDTARLVARNVTRGTVLSDQLEVAGGLWAKFMGLMGRRGLEPGGGLWLAASNGIHMMFMRFPIDAVFVGKPEGGADGPTGGRIVLSVHPGLRTWTGIVPLVRGANGVLELPIGTIGQTGTVVGDVITIS